MTVDEVKTRKEELQKELFSLLGKFEQDSGIRVNHIFLSRAYGIADEKLYSVKLELGL